MSARQPTSRTEIAALEAQRNAALTRAEGALLGERRAAIARLVMVLMFAVFGIAGGTSSSVQAIVGFSYFGFALVTLVAVRRARAVPSEALWRPLVITVVDFGVIATMGIAHIDAGNPFAPGRYVVAAAILISFAVSRRDVVHVAFAVALALVGLVVVSSRGDALWTYDTLFAAGGLCVLGFMMAITNRAVGEMFAGLRQRDNLTRFLPHQVAERVIRAGPAALAPVEREVTVMFTDIRGFTAISEKMSPRDVLGFLDDYFGRMSQIVKGHDGVVGKFLGDGLLAFWGVPDVVDDHALRAVRAARDMRKVVRELNLDRARDGLPQIRIGIGIHTGAVAAGMLGGALQSEYTVIGDAVNVASRIEGLTKQHGVDVLISETTFARLPEPRRGDKLASAEIRGRAEPIVLYTIDASAATIEISPTKLDGDRF